MLLTELHDTRLPACLGLFAIGPGRGTNTHARTLTAPRSMPPAMEQCSRSPLNSLYRPTLYTFCCERLATILSFFISITNVTVGLIIVSRRNEAQSLSCDDDREKHLICITTGVSLVSLPGGRHHSRYDPDDLLGRPGPAAYRHAEIQEVTLQRFVFYVAIVMRERERERVTLRKHVNESLNIPKTQKLFNRGGWPRSSSTLLCPLLFCYDPR